MKSLDELKEKCTLEYCEEEFALGIQITSRMEYLYNRIQKHN